MQDNSNRPDCSSAISFDRGYVRDNILFRCTSEEYCKNQLRYGGEKLCSIPIKETGDRK